MPLLRRMRVGSSYSCLTAVSLIFPATSLYVQTAHCQNRAYLSRVGNRRQFGHGRITLSSQRLHSASSLAEDIQSAYEQRETDGVLSLAQMHCDHLSPDEILEAAKQAANINRGKLASVINSFLASCYLKNDPGLATGILELCDEWNLKDDETFVEPDIVTLSLVYSTLHQAGDDTAAQSVLERAVRKSKKEAGSKRRKALAAARRKPPSSCQAVQEDLRSMLGDGFSVLWESDDAIIINKPAGVACFHKRSTTAGKIRKGKNTKYDKRLADVSLEDALVHFNVPLSTLNCESQGLVHRLDRGTSGCMVLAKSDSIHAFLVAEFFTRRIHKAYQCVVISDAAQGLEEIGVVDQPVVGRPALSRFKVIERFIPQSAALLEVATTTGRKHQVRIHCADGLKSPILGDSEYGWKPNDESLQFEGDFFLHAHNLEVPLLNVNVQAPLPSAWSPILKWLRGH